MNIYRRYFRVENGPVIDAVNTAEKTNDEAHVEYQKILKEIGATPSYYHLDRKLTGIVFKDKPDVKIYKKAHDNSWYPKKNCKAGKELAARFQSIRTEHPEKRALESAGLSNSPSIFANGKCYWSIMTVIPEDPKVAYISVPWYDENPEKITRYKKEKTSGTHYDRSLDSILWEPTSEMVEVKKWELDRHIDEYNEKFRKG